MHIQIFLNMGLVKYSGILIIHACIQYFITLNNVVYIVCKRKNIHLLFDIKNIVYIIHPKPIL